VDPTIYAKPQTLDSQPLNPKPGGKPKMFVVLVMSYAPNGDLFNKLERAHKEQKHIPEATIMKWLHQVRLI
jgi:hypothetical protein